MGRSTAWTLLLAVLAVARATNSRTRAELPFVSDEERELARQLEESQEQYCSHPFTGRTDEDGATALLKLAGGKNTLKAYVKEALQDKDAESDFTGRSLAYAEEVAARQEFQLPLHIAAVLLVVWLFFACQYKCQCCRCRSYKRIPPGWFKLLIWAVLAVLCALVTYFGMLRAIESNARVQLGAENFLCSSKKFASVALNGRMTEPKFPGTIAVLEGMEELATAFEDNSDFTNGIGSIIDRTSDIYKSSLVAEGTIKLLDGLHAGLTSPGRCALCDEMDILRPHALSALRDSVGYKLGKLRVNPPEPSQAQKDAIESQISLTAAPLVKLKNGMADLAEQFTEDGAFDRMQQAVSVCCKALLVISIASIGAALVLVLCGATSASKFICYETVDSQEDAPTASKARNVAAAPLVSPASSEASEVEDQEESDTPKEFNPYNPRVHQWASRTWCCGFCYCIVTLVYGALMSYTMVPVTETCLLLGEIGDDDSIVTDLEAYAGEGAEHLQAVVDGCILNKTGRSAYLMDILDINDNEGQRTNLADSINRTANSVYADLITNAKETHTNVLQTQAVQNLMAVFERDEDTLRSQLANTNFDCALFDWPDRSMPECDTKDGSIVFSGGCLSGYAGQDYQSMEMRKTSRSCDRDAYVTYLKEFNHRIGRTMANFEFKVNENKFAIQQEYERIFDQKIVAAIQKLNMDTDCRFLGVFWRELTAGMCYQSLMGINEIHDAYMLSGYCTIPLIFIMIWLWRMSKDNFDHFNELTPEEYEQIRIEEEAKRAEADRTNFFLAKSGTFEVKAPDHSVIPESVRAKLATQKTGDSWD